MDALASELLDLSRALAEGAANDIRWIEALDTLTSAVGAGAMLLGTTRREGARFELSGHRLAPEWIELVNGQLAGAGHNPIYGAVSASLRSNPGEVLLRPIRINSLISRDTLEASSIYRDAIRPAGFEFVMVMVLEASPTDALSLTTLRPLDDGDFTARDASVASAIGPSLRTALHLRRKFAIAQSFQLALDRNDRGIVLLADNGEVIFVNPSAQALLDDADGLSIAHGRLHAHTPLLSRQLQQLIAEADRARRGASLAASEIIRLARPDERPPLIARAVPVGGQAGRDWPASVALLIHDPLRRRTSTEELIARGLELSPAEAVVAARLWEGDTVQEIADRLGLSPNTVKTHLKTIYDRTGLHRQAALVRRIAELLTALGD